MGSVVPTLPGIDDGSSQSLSVTAISSRADGLPYANGSSGHAVLYDIRSSRPLAIKDQGYGLPVKNVNWIEGGSRMAGDGLILSPDKKVIKIWDWNSVRSHFIAQINSRLTPCGSARYQFCLHKSRGGPQ